MKEELINIVTAKLKQQEELIKELVLFARGATISIAGRDNDALFQMLLEKYPKSTLRFEILYDRFACLTTLQKKRLSKLKQASVHKIEAEIKTIEQQNRLFTLFCQKALSRPIQEATASPICLGATLDLAAKKIAGNVKKPYIGKTVRGERIQQKYLAYRQQNINSLQALWAELSSTELTEPMRYYKLYELLSKKWSKTLKQIGGNTAARQFLQARKLFEKKLLRGHRTNLSLYKKFFRRVTKYAFELVEEVPETLTKELGVKIKPVLVKRGTSAEYFIRNLKAISKKLKKQPHLLFEFQNDIEKSHHVIYCSLSSPYEIQDANFPGRTNFLTKDLLEFQLYFLFWSCFYDFSSIKRLYQLR